MTNGSRGQQNMAAHHAAQMMRQSANVVQQNMQRRRSAVFNVALPAEPVEETKTTGIGLQVARTWTFTINESEPIGGGVREYELLIDDKLVWSGMGNDRADALLEAIMAIADQEPETPN